MDLSALGIEKKGRRYNFKSLKMVRIELTNVYKALREADQDSEAVSYFRACAFLLTSIADVIRIEKQDDLEKRLAVLESRLHEGETDEKQPDDED